MLFEKKNVKKFIKYEQLFLFNLNSRCKRRRGTGDGWGKGEYRVFFKSSKFKVLKLTSGYNIEFSRTLPLDRFRDRLTGIYNSVINPGILITHYSLLTYSMVTH